jgi:hypothetical protein
VGVLFSWFGKEIMTDPPFLSISKSKSLCTGEKENAPAVKSSVSLGHGQIFDEQAEDFVLVSVQVVEPAFRGLGIVRARPSPPFFQIQISRNPQK